MSGSGLGVPASDAARSRSVRSRSAAPWLLAIAVVCLAAVGAALVAQHVFDMQPCPWCILQRLIYLVIAAVCVIGALIPARGARVGAALLALVLAGLGAASAVFQHQVAAKLASCDLTLADKVLSALGVESAVPWLFQVTASCADAAVDLLGVPFEYWSLALFVLLVVANAVVLRVAVQR